MKRSRIAIAIEDFKFSSRDKENWDLLRIKKGDTITVHVPDDGNGWEYGELKDKTGNFPSKCVKRTSEYTSLQSAIPTIIQLDLLPLTPEIAEKLKEYARKSIRAKKLETEFLINLNQRLSYSNEVLSHSLLKLNTNLNKLAVEINGNLIKYLNHSINSPKSKKVKLVRESLLKAVEFPDLVDEIYLQVLKLTVPLTPVDLKIMRKAWEIFTMVAISFSSKEAHLFEIIKLYLEFQNLPIKNKDPHLDRFIKHSLSQIQRRSSLNIERNHVPSNSELLGIKEMKFFQPVIINTSRNNETILVDSCTTVKEVISTVLGGYLYSIPPTNNFNYFSIYYQNNEKTYTVPLSVNTILADFLVEKQENPVKFFDLGILVWNFNYEENLYCNLLELIFNTVANRFLNFDFELSTADAVKAAGLLFHANNLDIPNKQNLSQFFPNYSLSKSQTSADNLLQRILAESTLYEQFNPTQARIEFLKFTESLKVYQASFFPVLEKKGTKQLAISKLGVILLVFLEDCWEIKNQWPFTQIVSCQADSFSICLAFVGGTRKSFVIQGKDAFLYCYDCLTN